MLTVRLSADTSSPVMKTRLAIIIGISILAIYAVCHRNRPAGELRIEAESYRNALQQSLNELTK